MIYEDQRGEARVSSLVADHTEFWWNERKPDEPMLWESKIELGEKFFNEITRHPVPWFRRYNAKAPEKGGAKKSRTMMSREWVKDTREAWERAANEALETLHGELQELNPSAARSLEEGLDETLTVHRLPLQGWLRRMLATTNPIESTFSVVETVVSSSEVLAAG